MKHLIKTLGILALTLIAGPSFAADTLSVDGAWVREAPPNAMMMAGYLTVSNKGDTDTALTAASSPTFGAIELHRSMEVDGVARMVPQENMPVPASGQLELKPGDYHLMMMHPKSALREGDDVELTLEFADGEKIVISAPVKRVQGGGHHHHHHH